MPFVIVKSDASTVEGSMLSLETNSNLMELLLVGSAWRVTVPNVPRAAQPCCRVSVGARVSVMLVKEAKVVTPPTPLLAPTVLLALPVTANELPSSDIATVCPK